MATVAALDAEHIEALSGNGVSGFVN